MITMTTTILIINKSSPLWSSSSSWPPPGWPSSRLCHLIRVAVCGERIEANNVSKKDRDALEVLAQVLIVKIWTTAFLLFIIYWQCVQMFLYFFPLLGLDPLNHSRGDKIMKSHLCSRLFLVKLYHLHFSLKSLKQGYLCHLVNHLFRKDLSESGRV